MDRHPWKRLAAWVVDCCLILVYAGVLAAVAVPLHLAELTNIGTQLTGNIVSAVVLVVPSVCVLAALEAGRRRSTMGKRALKLCVCIETGERTTFARSLARNVAKFGVPWLIGHAAVYSLVTGDSAGHTPGPATWILLVLAYVIPIAWVLSLFVRHGRTPYDLLSKTQVHATSATAVN